MRCKDIDAFRRGLFRDGSFTDLRNSLLDMDGTLVDSTAGVTAAWDATVKKYPGKGLSVEEILKCQLS